MAMLKVICDWHGRSGWTYAMTSACDDFSTFCNWRASGWSAVWFAHILSSMGPSRYSNCPVHYHSQVECWLSTQHFRRRTTTPWWVVYADGTLASSVWLLVQSVGDGIRLTPVPDITVSSGMSTLHGVTCKHYPWNGALETTIMLAGWRFMYHTYSSSILTVLPFMLNFSKATLLHRKKHAQVICSSSRSSSRTAECMVRADGEILAITENETASRRWIVTESEIVRLLTEYEEKH